MNRVTRLQLADFRSYPDLDLACAAHVVALAGENGAGKTNILEAISLFSPGRGLRRAELADMARIGGGGFAVSVEIEGAFGEARLGAGLERQPEGGAARVSRIDRQPVASATAFADHLRLVWLTPELDGVFRGPAGDRRRFLDRLVLAVDSGHAARTAALERALRNRNRLLEEGAKEARWLDALEREVAELAIAVTASRSETALRLGALILAERNDASPFPWAEVALAGELETLLAAHPATEAEERYRSLLREGRERDRAAGRTLIGPQASDLVVRHGPKAIDAKFASTGEQKALLVGLILAHARLVASMSGLAPIVLLDEVAAHLDPRRRAALYAGLGRLAGQVWLTGADPTLFADIGGDCLQLVVTPGRVERAA